VGALGIDRRRDGTMTGAVQIRDATLDDYDAFVPLFGQLGVDDPVATIDRFERELVPRMIVATLDDALVGYVLYEVLSDVGYIRNLVSDQRHRRRGIATALMEELRRRFVAAGATSWCLNVKPDNVPAIALYQRFGLRTAYRSSILRLASDAPPVDPGADLELREVPPDDDEAVEAATGLLRGQLASARAKQTRTLLQLRRGDAIVGVGIFLDTIPGAFPFRVTVPELGPPFLERLRALAPPGASFVQIGVEDDQPLRAALLARGATMHLEIEHMRGPLR